MSASVTRLPEQRQPRLGFLGAGWIGRMRMRSLAASETAAIVAIADPAEPALDQAAQIAPGAALVVTLEQLLRHGLDGVVIATPSALHAAQAILALKAGVAVFCQKPVGCNSKEATEVIEAARLADRLLATDFAYRFTRAMQLVRNTVRQGALGRVYAVDLCFHNSYGPDRAWYYDPATSGGGCVIDLATHLVDLALWTLDFPPVHQVSSRLFCQGHRLRSAEADEVEDFAFADFELKDGTAVHLACSWGQPMGQDAVIHAIYHGEHAAVEFRNVNGSFFDFAAEHYVQRERHILYSEPDDWSGRALLDWTQRLATSNRFHPSAVEILKVAKVIEAIYKSDSCSQMGNQ
ncbi:MAG: Gfo/Idh/MocA family oxidoreductase [Deltaproteobacteria bacterium]|nr:Gfo/Idh/MocA family oxidoreductase [Deltaproteobacteria bacterium]